MYAFIYDSIYYGVSLTMTLILLVPLVGGVRLWRSEIDGARRAHALGFASAALGTELALVTGVALNAIRSMTGDLFYQQAHFAVMYVGFGLILFGVSQVLGEAGTHDARWLAGRASRILRSLVWLAYIAATAAAGSALLQAGSSGSGPTGSPPHVAQQVVYFLPVFVTTAIGAVTLLCLASLHTTQEWRRRSVAGLGLFAALLFVGFLREATIIPSSGEPLIDLILAFGPFALAGICLWLGERFVEQATTELADESDGLRQTFGIDVG